MQICFADQTLWKTGEEPEGLTKTMSVPFIDLKRFEDGFLDRWAKITADLTANTRFVGGPEVAGLEERLAKENDAKFAVGCSSGTDALQLALRAAGVGRGDTVLVPDSTFWATFEAVVNVNADPVTVDIDPVDLQMSFSVFEEAVKKHKPKAAILVHLYGWGSARLDEFRTFCKNNNMVLIEDGAQSYGVEWKGKSIYSGAHIATISFYPAKTLGAAGDAGAVLTDDESIAKKMVSLANHGREEHYAHGDVGWNSRLSTFQAAYLNLALDYFPERLASRRKFAAKYREVLPGLGINVVGVPEGYTENGYLNATLHEPEVRDPLKAHLGNLGIGCGIVYPGAVSDQKGAESYIKAKEGGENARTLAKSVLNLPLFPYMTDAEFDEVLAGIKSFSK